MLVGQMFTGCFKRAPIMVERYHPMKVNYSTQIVPIFPLNLVLFPGTELPLHIFEERYKRMLKDVLDSDGIFGIIRQDSATYEMATIGCLAKVLEIKSVKDGRSDILVRGISRFEVLAVEEPSPYLRARIKVLQDEKIDRRTSLMCQEMREILDDLLRMSAKVTGQKLGVKEIWPDDPVELSYMVPSTFYGSPAEQQKLLEEKTTFERLSQELVLLEEARRHLAAQSAIKDALG